MTDSIVDYLCELFQSQVERGRYREATGLLKLLARRLPPSEIDRFRKQVPGEFVSKFDPIGTVKIISKPVLGKKAQPRQKTKAKTVHEPVTSINTPVQREEAQPRKKIKVRTAPGDLKRKQEIEALVARRKLNYLVHFTRACNVSTILEHGLLPRAVLQSRLGRRCKAFEINDHFRHDGHIDANCLSVSYPNYRMFYRYRQDDQDRCWAVLLIKADVLWKRECAFCTTNAASKCISSTPLEKLKRASALSALFDDYENGSTRIARSALTIPDHFPTNPQAEVLVFEVIPVEDITAVHLGERTQAFEEHGASWSESGIPIKISRGYFGPRKDHAFWAKEDA